MADFFDTIGQAIGNRVSNRFQDLQNTFDNPGDAFQNRVNTAMGQPVNTSTNQTEVTPAASLGGMSFQDANKAAISAGAQPGIQPPVTAPAVPQTAPEAAPLSTMPVTAPAVPQDYNASIAQQESGGNANIGYHDRNKSSAFGPYGMTAGAYQDARKVNPSLPADITQANPQQLTQAQDAYTQQNAKYLQAYGIQPDNNTLGAAHVIGAKGLSDYQTKKDEFGRPYLSPAAQAANGGYDKLAAIVNGRLGGQAAPASGAAQQQTAPPTGPATPYDMGEMAGVDQAVAQRAAANAGQPQISQAQQDAAMAAEMERQRHYEDLNSGDPKRLLGLVENPDKSISTAASGQLADIFKDKKLQDYAQNHVEGMLAKGQIPDPNKQKGEEGSYIKAYLFKRLGLTDLASQEQEKISPNKQHMPVMVGDQRYSAVYSKDGQLLSAKDETGKPADEATLNKIAANAFATKGATTGQTMMKDADGNIWSHTTTPGTNQIVWTNQSTGKAQTTAPTGLTPFSQINLATRANIGLATSAVRRMEAQNTKDRAQNLTPSFSQEEIDAEREKITNGGKPGLKLEKIMATPEPTTAEAGGPIDIKNPPKGSSLERLSPADRVLAEKMSKGEAPVPTGPGSQNTRGQMLQRAAYELNPSLDPSWYKQHQDTETEFNKGVSGRNLQSLNVAIDHMDTLRNQIKKLPNGQYPAVNEIVKNFQTAIGDPRYNSFDAAAGLIAAEVTKAIVANGGTGDERAEKEKLLAAKNSPEALRGVLDTYTKLLGGQMRGVKERYEAGRGTNWDARVNDRTRQAMAEGKIDRAWSPQDKEAAAWVKANSSDPRAEKIKQRLGLD